MSNLLTQITDPTAIYDFSNEAFSRYYDHRLALWSTGLAWLIKKRFKPSLKLDKRNMQIRVTEAFGNYLAALYDVIRHFEDKETSMQLLTACCREMWQADLSLFGKPARSKREYVEYSRKEHIQPLREYRLPDIQVSQPSLYRLLQKAIAEATHADCAEYFDKTKYRPLVAAMAKWDNSKLGKEWFTPEFETNGGKISPKRPGKKKAIARTAA